MNHLVIEVGDGGVIRIYADSDVDLTIVDWREVRQDAQELYSWEKRNPLEEAERELLHKTTGLKQVYP